MGDESADARIFLEWNEAASAWLIPLLEQPWAQLRGLIAREAGGYTKISPQRYQLERSPSGGYRVLWTAAEVPRPQAVFALIAARPKAPGVFLGLPIAIVVPIITALAGALLTRLAHDPASVTSKDAAPKVTESRTQEELEGTRKELADANARLQALASCGEAVKEEHEFALKRPAQDRVQYLLGRSHGTRLEAIKRHWELVPIARDLALQAEEQYVTDALAGDATSIAFTIGKKVGQQGALHLLGLGEPKVLSASDLNGR